MNKEYLKITLALLSILFGFTSSILCHYTFEVHEPSYILALILSFSLSIIGVVSCVFSFRRFKIIKQLRSDQLPTLARWQYTSKHYHLVEVQLEENRYISFSIIFLIGILGLLILLGLFFSTTPMDTLAAILFLLLLLVCCGVSFYLVHSYYQKQSTKQCEVIISPQYILFNGELHGIQKGLYYLEEVTILSDDRQYLQFTYGAPGTPYGPFSLLTIPIPEDQLQVARLIQAQYQELLQ